MAKRNSMSTARRGRNRTPKSDAGTENTGPYASHPEAASQSPHPRGCSDLKEIINRERRQLMKAHAVLRCVTFAMLYEDWVDERPSSPCFADAVSVAVDLVRQAVERLDVPGNAP
jgi:hypothetical protein